jgi:hypothetical protein
MLAKNRLPIIFSDILVIIFSDILLVILSDILLVPRALGPVCDI